MLNLEVPVFTTRLYISTVSRNVINDIGYSKCDCLRAQFAVPLITLKPQSRI